MFPTQDLHVKEIVRLLPPRALKAELPMTEACNATVVRGREAINAILAQKDPRLLVVVGPCSIHDPVGALEYAGKLNALRQEFGDRLEIVMRVYFEKPRTTIGWKGLINDPHLDNSYDIEGGLKKARRLLLDIIALGLPAATEFLDPIIPQYISDLISWAAIGARTTESQTHREMASGLSMPVGFKNGTDGSLQIAIDAMGTAMRPHSFIGIDEDGVTSIVRTAGNPSGHVVLRGGRIADQLRRGKHSRSGKSIGRERPAQGADGRLQPRQFRQTIGAARGSLAERHRTTRRRHALAHRTDGRKLSGRRHATFSQRQSGQPALRGFHHGRLSGLGSHRAHVAVGTQITA